MTDTPLARLLLERFRWFDDALRDAQAERLGLRITSAQSLLFADLPSDGARQADLARDLGVSRQAVNELIRGLEVQGLVEVVPDPTDGRAKLVRPTPQGRRSIAVALDVFDELEARLRSRLGASELDALRAALAADWGANGPPAAGSVPPDAAGGAALRSGRGRRDGRDGSPGRERRDDRPAGDDARRDG